MAAKQRILVTGGAGFIGTHTVVQLLKQGFKVSALDNLDNAVQEAVDRVCQLAGPQLSQNLDFHLVFHTQLLLIVFEDQCFFMNHSLMWKEIFNFAVSVPPLCVCVLKGQNIID